MLFNMTHTIISIVATAIAGVYGFIFTVALWIGREQAQAEYKWIQRMGGGKRANMPWWGGFDPRVWDTHSFLWNLMIPITVSLFILFM